VAAGIAFLAGGVGVIIGHAGFSDPESTDIG
jgi:hypothetical protein